MKATYEVTPAACDNSSRAAGIALAVRPRAALAALAAAALAVAATACGGSGADKAGGQREQKPLTVTLESEDDLSLTGSPEFAAAVERVSEGSMHIRFVYAGRGTETEFEKGVVEDVRHGKAELGIGDARVWDTIGATSFQALLAPFLVDSFELERRVLEGPLATRMLEGVEQAGVVGIALLPGPLRSPFGLSHLLLGPDDYRGATIGIRPSGLARRVLGALRASAKVYVPGSVSGLDGMESNPKAIDYNGWEGALTANVVLWPKPYTIFMNRDAFDALTPEQQEILRDAGRETIAPELEDVARDSAEALSAACARGAITLVSASAADVTALREAVQPVYEELESDPETKELIGDITEMRSAEPAAASALPRCRQAGGNAKARAATLEGRWKLTFTRDDLIAVSASETGGASVGTNITKDLPARITAISEFANGRYTASVGGRVVARGTYTVNGDVMTLVFDPPVPAGYIAGHVYRQRWNVYRDSLTFSRFHDSDADFVLLTNPLTRIH
jgi:TRAP-type C4-dicarboxylate transport system substrate-binding protein